MPGRTKLSLRIWRPGTLPSSPRVKPAFARHRWGSATAGGFTMMDDALGVGFGRDTVGRINQRMNAGGDTVRSYGYDRGGRLTSYMDTEINVPTCWNEPNLGTQCDEGDEGVVGMTLGGVLRIRPGR